MFPITILVVEDDDNIRESLIELMEDEGYKVIPAANGEEGMACLAAAVTLPHLILLDLMMPIMDGFDFCQAKNQNAAWGAIPTVVMSADGHVSEKQHRTGAVDYIKKPLDIDDLLCRITQHLPNSAS
jgi:two-component system chemotaxis response regulator CheY